MAQDNVQSFGSVYYRTGSTRGTSTSSGVLTVPTGFNRRVLSAWAWDAGNGLRNSNADPAATTGVGTFAFYRYITTNPSAPTTARFRAFLDHTLSAASAVIGSSRAKTLATSVTALVVNWGAFGY